MVAYCAPLRAEQTVASNLVLTRDRLDDEDLGSYADRHVAELAAQLRDFALRKREATEVDGRPAIALAFTSRGPGSPLEQRLTWQRPPAVAAAPRRRQAAEAAARLARKRCELPLAVCLQRRRRWPRPDRGR